MTGNNKPGRLAKPADRATAVRSLLTGAGPSPDRNTEAFYVPLDKLVPNPGQPRQTYDSEKEEEMRNSVKEQGILQPLIVRPQDDGNYQIVAGERRFRAAQAVGMEKVPVIIRKLDDNEVPVVSLAENLQRADLNPVDEQRFFQMLIDRYNFSANDIATMIHKSPGYVKNRLYGNLQNMQGGDDKADSEKTNKQSSQDKLLGKSQSKETRPANFKPQTAFKMVTKKLVETGEFLESLPKSDKKTQEEIRQSLAHLKVQIAELEKKLGS